MQSFEHQVSHRPQGTPPGSTLDFPRNPSIVSGSVPTNRTCVRLPIVLSIRRIPFAPRGDGQSLRDSPKLAMPRRPTPQGSLRRPAADAGEPRHCSALRAHTDASVFRPANATGRAAGRGSTRAHRTEAALDEISGGRAGDRYCCRIAAGGSLGRGDLGGRRGRGLYRRPRLPGLCSPARPTPELARRRPLIERR